MIDPCTLPFLTLGFFRLSGKPQLTKEEVNTYSGEQGAVCELEPWADLADTYWALMNAADPDGYYSVHAYDVAEPFGAWLREHGTTNTEEARRKLAELTSEGFTEPNKAALIAVALGVEVTA
ncbi:hypothetical protein [Variovorax sp. V15]|uniref:hypothetical protein n=1 Tax=Variovorax sp. V15 TaxID=3065952 RepID=UPI0034E89A26